MNRYTNQIQLAGIGARGQEKLAKARVVVVGAGGLGCAVIPQGASWSVTALFSLLTVLPALLGARAITRLGRAG